MPSTDYELKLQQLKSSVDGALDEFLSSRSWPAGLTTAVRYSLLAGGKRLRPVLVLLAAELCGGPLEAGLPAACAIEMIHTYSLIHDDLPAMDDDDLRRGRPTSHRVFGEALAILAGDCLLTAAFEVIADSPLSPAAKAELIRVLAVASGGSGMVGGQCLDLEAERAPLTAENSPNGGRNMSEECWNADLSAVCFGGTSAVSGSAVPVRSNFQTSDRVDHLTQIHTMKTGVLIAAAVEMGAICAAAGQDVRSLLRNYGHRIGLAFQIADDLLDVTGNDQRLGKGTGRDADLGKLTYPGLVGIDASRQRAAELVRQACECLEPLGPGKVWLMELARFIVERDH